MCPRSTHAHGGSCRRSTPRGRTPPERCARLAQSRRRGVGRAAAAAGEAISPGAAADSPSPRCGGGLSAGHPGFGAQGGLSAALEASAGAA